MSLLTSAMRGGCFDPPTNVIAPHAALAKTLNDHLLAEIFSRDIQIVDYKAMPYPECVRHTYGMHFDCTLAWLNGADITSALTAHITEGIDRIVSVSSTKTTRTLMKPQVKFRQRQNSHGDYKYVFQVSFYSGEIHEMYGTRERLGVSVG